MKVSVSVLKEKNNLEKVINKLNETTTDYIHLDIMDNTYTKSTSFKLESLKDIKTNKKYDIHIMSTNLEYQINEAIKLKPEYITFHYESTNSIIKYINLIKENNIKVGLAINPETSINKISEYLSLIDMVLVMSVKPGLGGQEFIDNTVIKLKELNNLKKDCIISVDGGINDKSIDKVKNIVDMVVVGSYLIDSNDYEETIKNLKK